MYASRVSQCSTKTRFGREKKAPLRCADELDSSNGDSIIISKLHELGTNLIRLYRFKDTVTFFSRVLLQRAGSESDKI